MTRTGKWGTKLTQNSPNLRGSCRVAIGLVGVLVVTAITSHPAQARHAAEPHHFRAHVMTHGHDYSPPYSAIVVDANSGNVLHSASPDEPRYPASLTKIMTLYLLFERLEAGKLKLDSQLSVSEHASVQAPTKLGLKPGQTIAVEDAIRGLVTKSANDAAVVVAEAIGGNESDFAEMMTKQAHALGMSRTVYRNASGLPNDEQLTTARDQAVLGRAIQERFPREYRYFSTPSFTYHGEAMRNHNRLLGQVEGVDGIKTGYTQASGFNLVTSVRRNSRHIVAVVLGGASAGARDARMRTLIEQHIAAASPQHTAPAIAEATGAKPATRAAEAQPGKASTYTVASFSPPAAWPASKFVPATPADPAPTATVAAPAAKSAATTPGIDAIKPQPKPAAAAAAAAAADANDTITPIRVKTVKVKLTQTHTAGLGPVAAAARDEPAPEAVAAPAPVAAPPPKVPAPAPKAVAIAPAAVAPVAPTPDVAAPIIAAPVAAAAPVVLAPATPARAAAAPIVAAPVVAAAPVAPAPATPARAAATPVIAAPVVAAAPVAPAPAVPARAAAAPAIAAPVVATAPVTPAPAAPARAAAAPAIAAPVAAAAPLAPAPAAAPPAATAVITAPVAAPAPVAPRAIAMAAAPRTREAVAPEPKADIAAHSASTHTGWIVQVGAFDVERDAQQRLSNAHAKVGHALDNADPFTEPVVKGDKTLYRARFAGFPQKDEADAVCKQLKRNDIDCMTIRN
jgi:D-alanyl-D-alanine carboxypeptidase